MKENKIKAVFQNNLVKGGISLTLATVVTQGLSLPMAVYFSNKMGIIQFGDFANYLMMLSIANIIGSLNLSACILRGKHEFQEEYDDFFKTVLITGIASIIIISGVGIPLFIKATEIGALKKGIVPIGACILMVVHSVFLFLFNSNVAKLSSEQRHKEIGVINIISTISTYIVVVLFFYIWNSNHYYERIVGTILVLAGVCIVLSHKNKVFSSWKLKKKYVFFAVSFSAPLIVHSLSAIMLNFFDSFWLKKIEVAGIIPMGTQGQYAFAYKLGAMVTILWGVFNKLWVPWFYEQMNKENMEKIREVSSRYVEVFTFLCVAFLMMLPELRFFIDTQENIESFQYIPIIALGCYFIFLYSFLSNTEFYNKKIKYTSLGSFCALILNVILNIIFIPKYGAWAAAGTTLFSYIALLVFHIILNDFILRDKVFPYRMYIKGIIGITAGTVIYYLFIDYGFVRWGILLLTTIIISIRFKRKMKW